MHFDFKMTVNKWIAALCFLLLVSCGKKSSGYDYKVALDASWYSLDISGRESALTAFTAELIEAIGSAENLKIAVYQRSWSNLMLGLHDNSYQAICTSMQPYIFYEKLYVFSDVYLPTGPVLVTRTTSNWNSLSQLGGLEVGIVRGSSYALILEKFPAIIQRTYDSIQAALDDVQQETIQACVLDILAAEAFTSDLYQGQLKISSAPLSQEGIRLVGLKDSSEELIRRFNRGFMKLKSNGVYSKIAAKWGLAEPLDQSRKSTKNFIGIGSWDKINKNDIK